MVCGAASGWSVRPVENRKTEMSFASFTCQDNLPQLGEHYKGDPLIFCFPPRK